MHSFLLSLIVLGYQPIADSRQPTAIVTTLDDRTTAGELVAVADGAIALKTDAGQEQLPFEKLLSVSLAAAPKATAAAGPVWVELVDGSLVPADDYQVKSGKATLAVVDADPLSLSARHVKVVRFLPQDDRLRAMWDEITAGTPKGDIVVLRKGGEAKPETLDFLEGVIRDVSPATIQFEFDGDVVAVNRAKNRVEGLIYFQKANPALAKSVCRVDDTAGAKWSVKSLQLEGETLRLTTPTGVEASLPLARAVQLDFSLGKIAWLSDLVPLKKSWQPYLAVVNSSASAAPLFDVRRDRNFSGGPLVLGEETFRKGLAVYSRTELTWRLPDKFSRLEGVAGIDPSQRSLGHVRLEIRGDDRVLFDKEIAGEAPPQPFELDTTGVGRITILVDYGKGLDLGDQLILANMRLVR
jgi:hypothetical protein